MAPDPRHIRIFISSPGDVVPERNLALRVIDELPHRADFRDRITLAPIAWDKRGSETPMLATITPQEAINQGLPKPSECDIVVVIFWARMGTPLREEYKKPDGSRYWSGTEWEFLDAFNAAKVTGKPLLLVYKRTEKVFLDDEAPDYEHDLEQKRRVKAFFESFVNPDGSIKQGYNTYEKPDDFREHFESHLETLVLRLLEEPEALPKQVEPAKPVEIWQGSPFSGLRAFTPADAPIFFGRGRETDALVKQVSQSRFVAVIGASGSGKSSLVGAGLIPQLNSNAISGSKDWYTLDFTPGENPFESLAEALIKGIPALTGDPIEYAERKHKLAHNLAQQPSALAEICDVALAEALDWTEVLLFIDQFEELFTLASVETRAAFADILTYESPKIRIVVTLRADFYHRCLEYPMMAEKLRIGSFPLAVPGERALYEMITRPAERAALTYEDDSLPEQILADTGDEPGNLALVAYTLDELYKLAKQRDDRQLTHEDYKALGGVQGAIGKRAESIFKELKIDQPQETLQRVFRDLVEVDERGTATRRRVPQSAFIGDHPAQKLVAAFTDARLLTTSNDTGEPVVEVAHEALFRNWKTLAEWIVQAQDDLRLLRQFERNALDWERRGRLLEIRPRNEQLKLLLIAAQELKQEITDPLLIDYADLNTQHIVQELEQINISHERRLFISERLGFLGDPRPGVGVKKVLRNGQKEIAVPEIVWCYVEAERGTDGQQPSVEIKGQVFPVQPFYIAKYQITDQQFQSFLDDAEGYNNPAWWQGLPEERWHHEVLPNQGQFPNLPRENVTWYQAVAFTKWLTAHHLGEQLLSPNALQLPPMIIGENAQIRLPTEWEWQWAAQGGFAKREYPWEGKWDTHRVNSLESGLGETTAVGSYPGGAAVCGALDMAGNVWELCLSEYESLQMNTNNSAARVVRGGSFHDGAHITRCAARPDHNPGNWLSGVGFRVICAAAPQ